MDRHSGRDGTLGIGELGFGHNFGGVQVNGVLGFGQSDYDTFLGGTTEVVSTYVKLETIHEVQNYGSGSLWLVLGGVALWGDADITRNYVVGGGAIDSSSGGTSVEGYGLRARLQWEQTSQNFSFSPYGELAYAHACLDGYTETGGAFPTRYDTLCEENTELRLGFDTTVPISDTVRLAGTLEGTRRFQEQGSNISGQVVGLGTFNVAQSTYEQDWLRAGAGFEADFGGSTLSLIGNATTKGETSNAWLAVNWRIEF